jgi:hypothetical protein
LEIERSTEQYARKRAAETGRREKKHEEYVEDFHAAVLSFLAFHPRHAKLAERLARAVVEHATPVGSGTVARTARIPIEERAAAAVIAWLRHQTSEYDSMKIARVKGKRREARRAIARKSHEILDSYRNDQALGTGCSLRAALDKLQQAKG